MECDMSICRVSCIFVNLSLINTTAFINSNLVLSLSNKGSQHTKMHLFDLYAGTSKQKMSDSTEFSTAPFAQKTVIDFFIKPLH